MVGSCQRALSTALAEAGAKVQHAMRLAAHSNPRVPCTSFRIQLRNSGAQLIFGHELVGESLKVFLPTALQPSTLGSEIPHDHV